MKKSTVWIIVVLVGLYIACQLIADVSATKLVEMWGIVLPAGSMIFAVTFTLRDMIHKRLGRDWARASIIMAAVFNLIMAGYFQLVTRMPAPAFYEMADAWNAIFSFVPAIVIGSIIAELVSELLDTEVYHLWRGRVEEKWHTPQWMRVLVSNAVSLPVDSFLFALFAFVLLPPLFGGEALPMAAAWAIVGGQIVWKAVITGVSMPLIYLVPEKQVDTTGLA